MLKLQCILEYERDIGARARRRCGSARQGGEWLDNVSLSLRSIRKLGEKILRVIDTPVSN